MLWGESNNIFYLPTANGEKPYKTPYKLKPRSLKYGLDWLLPSLRWHLRTTNAEGIFGAKTPRGLMPRKRCRRKGSRRRYLSGDFITCFLLFISWKGIILDAVCPWDVVCCLHMPGSTRRAKLGGAAVADEEATKSTHQFPWVISAASRAGMAPLSSQLCLTPGLRTLHLGWSVSPVSSVREDQTQPQ